MINHATHLQPFYYNIIASAAANATAAAVLGGCGVQDSSKGVAVETGCSGLHYIIGYYYYMMPPPSTAPPSDCTPLWWMPNQMQTRSPMSACLKGVAISFLSGEILKRLWWIPRCCGRAVPRRRLRPVRGAPTNSIICMYVCMYVYVFVWIYMYTIIIITLLLNEQHMTANT